MYYYTKNIFQNKLSTAVKLILRKSSTDLLRSGQARLHHVLFRPVELRLVLLPADVGVVEVDDEDQAGLLTLVQDLVLEAVVNDRPLEGNSQTSNGIVAILHATLPCPVSK